MTVRVLVITDNAAVYSYFEAAIAELELGAVADFQFRHSSRNRDPSGLPAAVQDGVDLRMPATVAWILNNFDIVFSAHCKQIFPPSLVRGCRCYNIHPGLNPHNRGWFPHVFSIVNKRPAGVTIHEIDDEIDHGPIISQTALGIEPWETSADVYEKIMAAEAELLKSCLPAIIHGDYAVSEADSEGNYNSMADFRQLCKLDLNSVGSLGEHIDLLRALTHGRYRNAYFDDADGQRVYVRIELTPGSS
ncbi:MAG: dTDP-4-amino-4,6-dideoxyglucose formyltransferase [Sphingomonadales bacterium]|jgi:methionyl-tRNA formyltransferase|nr:dTDP-4-amino-4,6-dideoxyglucose formyltransferase [Sphingomonadales bacterium]